MPRGDGTGPTGLGPMTGRAAGYCAGYNMPGYTNPIRSSGFGGRGYFGGGGRGRGYRNMFYATGLPGWMRYGYASYYGAPPFNTGMNPAFNKEEEVGFLREQAVFFQKALDDINNRLNELETSKGE